MAQEQPEEQQGWGDRISPRGTSSSWEARLGCGGPGGTGSAPRAEVLGVSIAYQGCPATESPGAPAEGSGSGPAVSLPDKGNGEERGRKEG